MCIEFEHPYSSVTGGFAPCGTLITSCSDAESLTFQWDAETFDQACDAIEGRLVRSFPDASQFICSRAQNSLAVYESGTAVPVYEVRLRTPPTRVDWHNSGRLFVACGSAIRVVQIANDSVIDLYKAKPKCRILPSPSGDHLAVVAGLTAQIIDTANGQPVGNALKHKRPVSSGFWIDDDSIVLSSEDSVVRRWDVNTGQTDGPLFDVPGWVMCLEVAARSSCVLIGTQNQKKLSSFGGELRLYDYQRGVAVSEPMTHSHSVIDTCFHPSERYAASASIDKSVAIWDLTSSTKVAEFDFPGTVYGVRFSPSGHYLFAHGHTFSFIQDFTP